MKAAIIEQLLAHETAALLSPGASIEQGCVRAIDGPCGGHSCRADKDVR